MSIPAIIEILGLITNVEREFVVPYYYHFIRLKSDIPSQVSSIFKKILPLAHSLRNSIVHCCLKMMFYDELAWNDTGLIFLYFIPRSFFITSLIFSLDTLIWCVSSKDFWTNLDESMNVSLEFRYSTWFRTISLWFYIWSLFAIISSKNALLFFAFFTIELIADTVVLNSLATSCYFSYSITTLYTMIILSFNDR